jgi:hypothetical protein
MALRTLDEADAWDEELVAGACEWLAAQRARRGPRLVRGADGRGVATRSVVGGGGRAAGIALHHRGYRGDAARAPRRASVARRGHGPALAADRRSRRPRAHTRSARC